MRARRRGNKTISLGIALGITAFLGAGIAVIADSNGNGETPIEDLLSPFSRPDLAATSAQPGVPHRTAWDSPPLGFGPRGAPNLLYDNGEQLDDFNDPASQLSLSGVVFDGAAADDFVLTDIVSPDSNFQINMIRAPFTFFGAGADMATPLTTWVDGIDVVVFANSPLDKPDGAPLGDGTYSGIVVAQERVPVGSLTEQFVDACRDCYVVDIPVDFPLAKNTQYWLALIPVYPGFPQTAWCISLNNTGLPGQVGFPLIGTPYWDTFPGNFGEPSCMDPPPPPAGTNQDLSFQIYGTEVPPDVGACCNTTDGSCANVLTPAACVAVDEQFFPGAFCELLNPPCNEGACCYVDGMGMGVCETTDETDCLANLGGFEFNPGVACPINCSPPPPNDDCADAELLIGLSDSAAFDTTRATVEPGFSPPTACGDIVQDVWYEYTAPCDGTVVITTLGSTFDTIFAVYGPTTGMCPPCPVDSSSEIACNDDFDGVSILSHVIVPASSGDCFKIRVGGTDGGGPGFINVNCVMAGQGACCDLSTRQCTATDMAGCMPPGVFFEGDICSDFNCPPPPDNDNCTSATQLNGQVSIAYDTTLATTDGTNPDPACGILVQDIWYAYTVPCTGDVIINTQGSAYDTFIAVYDFSSGFDCPDPGLCLSLGSLELGCSDDLAVDDTSSEVVVTGLTAGDCLMIRVGGKDLGLAMSGGIGVLNIGCLGVDEGACCDVFDRTCTITDAAGCPVPNEFTLGNICSPIVCPPSPANDDCPDALLLSGSSVLVVYDSTAATSAGPSTACGDIVQDLWYSYRVPCEGNVTISTDGSMYDTMLAVYGPSNGSGCPDVGLCPLLPPAGDGSETACSDDAIGILSEITLSASAGDCLLIRVGGPDPGSGLNGGVGVLNVECVPLGLGSCCHADRSCDELQLPENCVALGDVFTLGGVCSEVTCPPLPDNDACENALAVSLGSYVYSTVGATTDGPTGLPLPGTCIDVENDLWYSITAPCTGVLTVTVCGSTDYDSAIAIYTGTDCPLIDEEPIACDNDGCASPTNASEVLMSVTAGSQFLIRVGGALGATGTGVLTISCTPGAVCCLGDVDLNGVVDMADLDVFTALLLNPPAMNDPEFCPADVNEDMLVNGDDLGPIINLVTGGTMCEPLITGACCFTSGACNKETQEDCFNLGGTYQGNGTGCGAGVCPAPPANDDCDNALMLTCNMQITFSNLLASTEPSDPDLSCLFGGPGPGAGSAWFQFTATANDALISTCNSQAPVTDTIIAVYDATASCPLTIGDEIACNEDAGGSCQRLSEVCVEGLVIGNVYTIYVATDEASRGDITLDVMCPCPSGACCLPDGTCQILRSDECLQVNGSFKGDGVPCDPSPCSSPLVAIECCTGDINGDGAIDTLDIPAMVISLLNPPTGLTLEFCRTDANGDQSIDSEDIDALVELILSQAPCGPPANDECASSLLITCNQRVLIDNSQATTDASDPAFSCRAGAPGQGVGTLWFSFEATDTSAYVSTCDSISPASDTILAVYDGSCPLTPGDELACSEDAGLPCGERLSEVCVTGLTIGQIYHVQVASFDSDSLGLVSVEVACPCP